MTLGIRCVRQQGCWRDALLAMVAVLLSACGDADPSLPEPEISFDPRDLTSNVSGAPLAIVVTGHASAEQLSRIADAAFLETHDGATIPSSATIYAGVSGSRIVLKATGSPTSGWVEFGLDTAPFAVGSTARRDPSGRFGARTSASSSPTLRRALICNSSDAEMEVSLEFSEDVSVPIGAAEVSIGGVICELTRPEDGGLRAGRDYRCQPQTVSSQSVKFRVTANVRSASAAPFRMLDGASEVTFEVDTGALYRGERRDCILHTVQ